MDGERSSADQSTPRDTTRDTTLGDALGRYRDGDYAAAARLFGELRARAPDDLEILRLHGLSLVRAGRVSEGLPHLARACAAAPSTTLAHLHHGIGLLAAGRPARAAARFRRATVLAPAAPAAWINFASALLALDQARPARAAARRALKLAPDDAAALRALGCGHAAAGNLADARAALWRSVQNAPDYADAWIDLGHVLARQGDISDAVRCMERAVALRPNDGAARANIAAFAVLRGDMDDALGRLRAILDHDPTCVAARVNLVNALLLDNDAAAALALLDGTPPRGREGAHWLAYRALALIALRRNEEAAAALDAIPTPYGDAEILITGRRLHLADRAGNKAAAAAAAARLSELAGRDAFLYEHRIISQFDLARHHVRAGRRGEAFAHWSLGHRLLAKIQPFSRDRHGAFVDTSIAAFGVTRLRDCVRATNEDEAPVFVVGLPRSGTTLCEQILAAHAEVRGCGERSALPRCIQALAGMPTQAATIERLAALATDLLDGAAANYLTALHAEGGGARRLVDKMPGNALHLGFIATLLPRARIILCRRDPRDVGLSIFQLRFFGYHPYAHDLADLGWYIRQHERLMSHWLRVMPERMIEVNLTDWINNFDMTLRRVLAFLSLPYDPACETFYRSDRRVRTASAAQVRQPVNSRGIGRWRAFKAELAPMLAELEHVTSADK